MKRSLIFLLLFAVLLLSCKDNTIEISTPEPPIEEPEEGEDAGIVISFEGNTTDTLLVNTLNLPSVIVEVRSEKALATLTLFRVKQDKSAALIKSRSSFEVATVYRDTLSPVELGLNLPDVVALRIAAEDEDENYVQKQLVYKFVDPAAFAPQIRFTNVTGDTLKVNTDPNATKPTPCFTVSGVMDTVKLFLLKKSGSTTIAQQHGNSVTSFTAGVDYDACFESVAYSVDVVGLRVYATNGDEITMLDLPVVAALDLNAAPNVKFLSGSPLRVNGNAAAIKPYVQFRVTSSTGLQKLVLSRVNYDTEYQLAEITSFANSKDFTREILELVPTAFAGLERIVVEAYDVTGKYSKGELQVDRYNEVPVADENVAFPGADGFAASTTTGGRGGSIYYVTNLNDAGTGSLRDAVSQSNRIVIFKVSGIIALTKTLQVTGSNLTIAGQTAPGDGICIKNYSMTVNASNVIVRYLRFRMGDEKGTEDDAFWGRNQSNIIIDHCSMSWSTDECSSFYDNTNFTMQWCILSESLRVSVHAKGTHGYGGIWGGKGASFHHNLLAHHDSRNPRFCGSRFSKQESLEKCDFRNNVVYNWGGNSGYAGEGGVYNFINNYYKPGKATGSGSMQYRIFSPNGQDQTQADQQTGNVWGKFWLAGNYVYGSAPATADNWLGLQPNASSGSPLPGGNIANIKLSAAVTVPQATTHTAEVAFERVLDHGGASYRRDAVDARVTNETRNGLPTVNRASNGTTKIGLIDTQTDVGGWPTYETYPMPLDTDNDGMPDAWEIANGLNPNVANANGKDLSSVYTNIEVYINSLVQEITVAQQKQ